METFGAGLKGAFLASGMTRGELAQQCGLSQPSQSEYFTREYAPRSGSVARLAAALGVTEQYLRTGAQERSRSPVEP